MDKILKFLKKLTFKERNEIAKTIRRIKMDDLGGLKVRKLKGYKDLFRIRKGKFRIIFRKTDKFVELVAVEERDENTYRHL